jgi:hypothetical protein
MRQLRTPQETTTASEVSLGVHVFKRILHILATSVVLLPVAALAATPITGTVMNLTTNTPSAGDQVELVRLAQGEQVVATGTTDAQGHYSLAAPDDGLFLVRVTHEKTTYFGPAPQGTRKVDVSVYSVSPHVTGVSTEAAVVRAQTDPSGTTLNVVENFFVENNSKPAMTQLSDNPFDFYLPAGAVVEGSAALAPGGLPVVASPTPLPDKGHYTFKFPIRPGETRFQVSYSVAYPGSLSFDVKIPTATDTFAVIVPTSITFTPAVDTQFKPVNDASSAQAFVARFVGAGQSLSFQLTGTGALPRDTEGAAQGGQGQGGQAGAAQGTGQNDANAATDDTAPGKGLGTPLDPNGTREPLSTKYKWWIMGGLGLLLVVAAGILLRKPTNPPVTATTTATGAAGPPAAVAVSAAGRQGQLLDVLKEELFALETDRLQEHITEADYLQQKAAIELILRRVLQRGEPAGDAPPISSIA